MLGYFLLEHDDVAAVLDDRAHRFIFETIDFIDLLAVADEKKGEDTFNLSPGAVNTYAI